MPSGKPVTRTARIQCSALHRSRYRPAERRCRPGPIRNLFRDSAHAYATDGKARRVAGIAIGEGFDTQVEPALQQFFYMPLMHSENLADQEACVALCEASGAQQNIDYARIHRNIIARFGPFPHRNAALGRTTRPE